MFVFLGRKDRSYEENSSNPGMSSSRSRQYADSYGQQGASFISQIQKQGASFAKLSTFGKEKLQRKTKQ